MKINEEELFNTIYKYTLKKEFELNDLNEKGIFFAPELYLAFGFGKEITKNRIEIFDVQNIDWGREDNLGNGGPSDIIIRNKRSNDKSEMMVMEIKLRDNYNSYKADIEKLLHPVIQKSNKYFCVLLDSFKPENDERLTKIENEYKGKLRRVNQKSFKTNQDWYNKQIYCVLNLYRVTN